MKKNEFNERLKVYGSLSAGILLASSVGAQVVYTDVNPDETINSSTSTYGVDFNGDMTVDLMFVHSTVSTSFTQSSFPITANGDVIAVAASNNGVIGTTSTNSSGTAYLPNVLPLSANINSTAQWQTNTAYYGTQTMAAKVDITVMGMPYGSQTGGNWLGTTDGYLGAKFTSGANTHYGWVRLDVAADASSATIKDYAYDATPNAPILAGDMVTTSIPEMGNILIWKQQNNISINFGDVEYHNATIQIYNILGQKIIDKEATNKNMNISTQDFHTGVYIIAINIGTHKITHKFSK